MTPSRVLAVARHELRVLRHDFFPLVLLIIIPLLLMPFIEPACQTILRAEGLPRATGAEQAIPGMAVTFGFFLTAYVGIAFFREHAWQTWDRLRASPASTREILAGKIVVPLLGSGVQFLVLFGLGGLLIGLRVQGSWLALAAVAAAFGLYLVCTGLAIAAVCRTIMQIDALATLGALVLSSFAGAIVPRSLLPHWAIVLAPLIPSHWAMYGYQQAILHRHGSVAVAIAALLGFSAFFALIAVWRLRFDDVKHGFM